MKKIPTLFERIFENHKKVGILHNVTPEMEWVLEGKGIATVKYDGSCCAIIDGKFYKDIMQSMANWLPKEQFLVASQIL